MAGHSELRTSTTHRVEPSVSAALLADSSPRMLYVVRWLVVLISIVALLSSCVNSHHYYVLSVDSPGPSAGSSDGFVVPLLIEENSSKAYAIIPDFRVGKGPLDCSGDIRFLLRRFDGVDSPITYSEDIMDLKVVLDPEVCRSFRMNEIPVGVRPGSTISAFIGETEVAKVALTEDKRGAIEYLTGSALVAGLRAGRRRSYGFFVAHDPAPLIAILLVIAGAAAIATARDARETCKLRFFRVGWIC